MPPRKSGPTHQAGQEVVAALRSLPEEYVACRDLRHWFERDGSRISPEDGTAERKRRCHRCGLVVTTVTDRRGYILSTSSKYPDGYLLQGLGRLGRDGNAALRMVSLMAEVQEEEPSSPPTPQRRRRK